jgi:hypothetical protein
MQAAFGLELREMAELALGERRIEHVGTSAVEQNQNE